MSNISRFIKPQFYWNRLYRDLFLTTLYDKKSIVNDETKKLREVGEDLEKAIVRLNTIYQKKYHRDFNFDLDSIHPLLWSLISTDNKPVKRILEIGTSVGEGTCVLAELFPNAEIVTFDLPEGDPHLRQFYMRDTDEQYKSYLEKQSKNIEYPNIDSIKVNSFFLPAITKEPFDLIWIDGGHLYPEVAWDICNAWNVCVPGGIIMCDDIIPKKKLYKTRYASSESYEVLNYLAERTPIEVKLFLKRRDPNLYPFVLKRKYVAYFRKVVS